MFRHLFRFFSAASGVFQGWYNGNISPEHLRAFVRNPDRVFGRQFPALSILQAEKALAPGVGSIREQLSQINQHEVYPVSVFNRPKPHIVYGIRSGIIAARVEPILEVFAEDGLFPVVNDIFLAFYSRYCRQLVGKGRVIGLGDVFRCAGGNRSSLCFEDGRLGYTHWHDGVRGNDLLLFVRQEHEELK